MFYKESKGGKGLFGLANRWIEEESKEKEDEENKKGS